MTISLQTKNSMNRATFGQRKSNVTDKARNNLAVSSSNVNKGTIKLNGTRKGTFTPGVNNADRRTYNYDRARANLNSRASYTPPSANYDSSFSNMSMPNFKMSGAVTSGAKFGMYAGLAVGALGLINTFTGGGMSAGSALSSAFDGLGGDAGFGSYAGVGELSMSLSSATTFNEINTAEATVIQEKTSLNNEYSKNNISQTVKEKLTEDVQYGLKEAGVDFSADIAKLNVQSLNFNDLEGSMKKIDQDINEVQDFTSTKLAKAEGDLSAKSGQLSQSIAANKNKLASLKAQLGTEGAPAGLETQIQELENQIAKDEKILENVKKAQAAITEIKTECDTNITSLKQAKAKCKDIKAFEDGVKDKKFNMAKTQDKELGKILDKLKKYEAKAKTDSNYGEKHAGEIAALKQQMGKLVASLSAAGEIKSSKGETYTIQNLQKATLDES